MSFALTGWTYGLLLCGDPLDLGRSEKAFDGGFSVAFGSIQDNGLKQALAPVDYLITQALPAIPGVCFLGDPGGGLGILYTLLVLGGGLGCLPCSVKSLGKCGLSLAENRPRSVHDL